jgi:ADP-ribose pyrophosphatase
MELKKEETLTSKYLFEGRVIKLRFDEVRLQNGNTSTREIVEHPGGVCIAPVDENGNVLMVRQYRRPFDQMILEVPAGKLNYGEDPYECGVRELEEETGFTTDHMEFLGEAYLSPGFCNEVIHVYMTEHLIPGTLHPDEDEFINVERIPIDQLVTMIMSGEIRDAKTQIAILKLKNVLDQRNSN